MTDKELNSHDLAREIEIVKLQEENKRLNGAIQTYNILLKSNIKANEELKSQLRGTTHCFDEEEHNKLKEENQELKLELSGYRQAILNNKEMLGLKEQNEKLKKQLENCYCNRTDCSGRIKDSKVYDSLVQKVETQQKEFIEWLEDMLDDENDIFSVVRIKDALQKYREIIGVSDEKK